LGKNLKIVLFPEVNPAAEHMVMLALDHHAQAVPPMRADVSSFLLFNYGFVHVRLGLLAWLKHANMMVLRLLISWNSVMQPRACACC
jgi:hypothetical protein